MDSIIKGRFGLLVEERCFGNYMIWPSAQLFSVDKYDGLMTPVFPGLQLIILITANVRTMSNRLNENSNICILRRPFWLIWNKYTGLQKLGKVWDNCSDGCLIERSRMLHILWLSELLMHLSPQHTCAETAKPYYPWGCDVTMQRWMRSNWHFPQNLTRQLKLLNYK